GDYIDMKMYEPAMRHLLDTYIRAEDSEKISAFDDMNLELAKKPPECLEYILVHEMVHLLERHHNDRFKELMDKFMPRWRLSLDELNRSPLTHEDWKY
ncbi:MAG: YgjP-like metallopeptidase domain-containing protein, partial [Candidatus Auribacterota bacterium]|nr:YgjP-like metallopeptidase domain-containing protein [Candidatus Auribacterota bacterium]